MEPASRPPSHRTSPDRDLPDTRVMLRKFGFILAVLLFGALLFLAGMLAPDALRQSVAERADYALAALPDLTGESESDEQAASDSGEGDDGTGQDQAPPRYGDLLSRPFPNEAILSLVIGMESNPAGADSVAENAASAGYETRRITVRDNQGRQWTVVTAGEFENARAAREARALMASDLNLPSTLQILALPPPDD